MKNYNFNVFEFAKQIVPPQLRNLEFVKFIEVLLKPLKTLHQDFLSQRTEDLKNANITSQRIIFESTLNDKFDDVLRQIRIENNQEDNEYFYLHEENQNGDIPFIYLFSEIEDPINYFTLFGENTSSIQEGDFLIRYPNRLSPYSPELKAAVEKIKLAGKKPAYEVFS